MTQLTVFDYNSLVPDVREFLFDKEKTIKYRMANSIIDTGRDLMEAKEKCGHGTFIPWVNHAFGMSKERAAEYMRVAKEFDGIDSNLLDQFGKSALVMLSSRSVPAEVRERALELAESGEKVSVDVVKKLREEMDLLKYENTQLSSKAPEVEIIEKVVEVVPEDYQAAKEQAASVMKEFDSLRRQADFERVNADNLKKKLLYERSLAQITAGIDLIHSQINVCTFDDLDVPFSMQSRISDVISLLRQFYINGFVGIDTDKASRDKLLRAGFTLIRPDESSLAIKKYDGEGVWSKHSEYENRSSFRDALKFLSDNEKVILA